MTTTETNVFHAAFIGATALLTAPLLADLVVRPAYQLGWSAAAFCANLVSNGFLS